MSDSPRSSPRASIPPRVSGTLLLLTIGFAIAYACISLFRHWHFGSGYDLAIFDQAIWRLSHFDTPASTLSRHANIFGDHFSPILIVLTPIYWLAPAPETLLVAQALLLASSIVPVHLCLRMRLDPGYAWPLTISYALFWGIQRTALSDFHELAFAPLLLGLAVLAALRGRWGRLWIYVCLICLTKEDLVPFLGGLGLYLTWTGAKRRGLLLIVTSIVAFLGIMTVVIPWLNGGQPSAYAGQYADLLARPWLIPVRLLTPMDKSETVLFWLLPFLFLPLFSSLSVLAVPIAIARLLSPNPNHWGHGGHYSAPLPRSSQWRQATRCRRSRVGSPIPSCARGPDASSRSCACCHRRWCPATNPFFVCFHRAITGRGRASRRSSERSDRFRPTPAS
jgi:uncharacterized membrane protein